MIFAKALQSHSVPEAKNTIFVKPEFSRWPALVAANRAALEKLPGRPESRAELLEIAAEYTRAIVGDCVVNDTVENIIVTGHQARWHHCGILAKDIVTAELAKQIGGAGMHLVLDHDVYDTAMIVPKLTVDGNRRFEKIAFEREQNEMPLEFRPAPSPAKTKVLIEAVVGVTDDSLCGEIWPESVKSTKSLSIFDSAAEFITYFQAILKRRLGINIMYLPMSRLSQSNAFADFTASIIARAADFARIYNGAISRRIVESKVNCGQTLRPLTIDVSSGAIELPFWLLSREGRRASLYAVTGANGQIAIGTESWQSGTVSVADSGRGVEQLKKMLSSQAGYHLGPKAVTLTLFARLFLGDLFVHGVGGSLYEYITDDIIESYYGI